MKIDLLTMLLCLICFTTPVHADVLWNPLIEIAANPVLLVVLIIGIIVLTKLLKLVRKDDTK